MYKILLTFDNEFCWLFHYLKFNLFGPLKKVNIKILLYLFMMEQWRFCHKFLCLHKLIFSFLDSLLIDFWIILFNFIKRKISISLYIFYQVVKSHNNWKYSISSRSLKIKILITSEINLMISWYANLYNFIFLDNLF